jgi:alpha-tubulin suppressor-like RCC1 family protein
MPPHRVLAISSSLLAVAVGIGCRDSVAPASPIMIQVVAAQGLYTCGLTSAQAPYCWGENSSGQLGNGSSNGPAMCGGIACSSTPVAVSGGLSFSVLTAGNRHACALAGARAAYCWGANTSSAPVAVSGGLSFSTLSAGDSHTCGLTTAGTAYCWGASSSTPVAVPGGLSFNTLAAGSAGTCGLTSAQAAYCWDTTNTTPVAVSGGLSFSALTMGGFHTCGLTNVGTAYCWGNGYLGDLGNGSGTPSADPVAVSGDLHFSVIDAGFGYTCGLTSAGEAYCWGENTRGQLGVGTTAGADTVIFGTPGGGQVHTFTPSPVPVHTALRWTSITAGNVHTCALTRDGAVYCWGDNVAGELGDGTTTQRLVPTAVAFP